MLKHYKTINRGGVCKTEHRIVMEKKLGRELRSDEIVHHIDGDKWNNDPNNLMVVTRSEHAAIHQEEISQAKPVVQLNENGDTIKEWPSARAASLATGVWYQNIYKCCRGYRNTAGGFGWRYKEA